jgi:glycosyltransferase involved in cell wall biosynthesis
MTDSHSLSVVVPAFNESECIGGTLAELRACLAEASFDWEIRVVDDGSTDETRAIVSRASADDPRVVLQAEPHRGKGGAVRAGMLAASGSRRFLCDADLSMPTRELPRFLELVPDSCDIVVGSREGATALRVGEPSHRHAMGRGFNYLVRAILGLNVADTQCGFKLFSAGAADAVFQRVTIKGWAFDTEVLLIASRLGLHVRELPIEWHYRDKSHVVPMRDTILMAKDVVRIRLNAMKGQYSRQGVP